MANRGVGTGVPSGRRGSCGPTLGVGRGITLLRSGGWRPWSPIDAALRAVVVAVDFG